MKCMLLCVLLSATFMLISCVGPFPKKNPAEIQTAETHEIWSSHFFFPNKPNAIWFHLVPPGIGIRLHYSRDYEVYLSCEADSVGVIVIQSDKDWHFPPVSKIEIVDHHRTAYPCGRFNEFIRRLTSSKSEKCISRLGWIFYTDELNSLRYIPSNWPLCLYDHDETTWNPLDSVVYALRNSDADVGEWKDWVSPLKIFNKTEAIKSFSLNDFDLPRSFDKRLYEKKQIILMNPAADFIMVENLDHFSYFRAFVEENRVVYELSERGKILKTSEDVDAPSFDEMLESLNSYKTEMWMDSAKCNEPLKSFYWNDEKSLNSIYFHCETENQEVWSLRKKVEDWFKSKLNMLEENEMNTDGSKNEPGNQGMP